MAPESPWNTTDDDSRKIFLSLYSKLPQRYNRNRGPKPKPYESLKIEVPDLTYSTPVKNNLESFIQPMRSITTKTTYMPKELESTRIGRNLFDNKTEKSERRRSLFLMVTSKLPQRNSFMGR